MQRLSAIRHPDHTVLRSDLHQKPIRPQLDGVRQERMSASATHLKQEAENGAVWPKKVGVDAATMEGWCWRTGDREADDDENYDVVDDDRDHPYDHDRRQNKDQRNLID
jgi:hypothetical protein